MLHAVAVSPHLDDAAFSCGGTLALLSQAGWKVTVCTLFTRSVPEPGAFALACQLDKGLPPDADYMAIRRAEDVQACARLGAAQVWLDFPEAPHRGYDHPAALFGALHPGDEVHIGLAAALTHVLRATPDLVLAPQAIGGHIDHVQAVRALRLALTPGVPVLWWTDFPYAARPHTHPACPFEQEMTALPTWSVEGQAATRLAACACYVTQLGFQFGGRGGLDDILSATGAVERFRLEGCLTVPPSCCPIRRSDVARGAGDRHSRSRRRSA